MHFLLISDYFKPIIKSGSVIMGDLSEEIANQGNKVTVITFNEEQNKLFEITNEEKITVLRIRAAHRNKNRVFRLVNEWLYPFKIIYALKGGLIQPFDACICYSPSIFYGKSLKFIRKKYKKKVYLIIRDIFPKWAVDAGVLKKGIIYHYFKHIEKALYFSCDFMGIESKSDLNYFLRYKDSKEIEVLNNWGANIAASKTEFESIQNDSVLKIIYGGNIGDAQDLLSLVKNIDFERFGDNINITIIGDGDQKKELLDYQNKRQISQLNILDSIAREEYLELVMSCDLGLVRLNPKLKSNNFPLKMMGYIQLGLPIIASVNEGNEIIKLIQENKIGKVSDSLDFEQFNNDINEILSNKASLAELGKNAKQLFEAEFTVSSAFKKIDNKLRL